MTKSTTRVAVYVDAQHLWIAARVYGETLGLVNARTDYAALVPFLKAEVAKRLSTTVDEVSFALTIYSVSKNRAHRFNEVLEDIGYTVNDYVFRHSEDTWDWDTQIAIDVATRAENYDATIIVSGDGDLAPAIDSASFHGPAWAAGFPGSTSSRFTDPFLLTERVLYSKENRR